jgi:hypothetical protein
MMTFNIQFLAESFFSPTKQVHRKKRAEEKDEEEDLMSRNRNKL